MIDDWLIMIVIMMLDGLKIIKDDWRLIIDYWLWLFDDWSIVMIMNDLEWAEWWSLVNDDIIHNHYSLWLQNKTQPASFVSWVSIVFNFLGGVFASSWAKPSCFFDASAASLAPFEEMNEIERRRYWGKRNLNNVVKHFLWHSCACVSQHVMNDLHWHTLPSVDVVLECYPGCKRVKERENWAKERYRENTRHICLQFFCKIWMSFWNNSMTVSDVYPSCWKRALDWCWITCLCYFSCSPLLINCVILQQLRPILSHNVLQQLFLHWQSLQHL